MSTLATTRQVNVLDPDLYVDPWDDYRWLREEVPVYWDPAQKLWAISRYADVIAIEKDGGRYSSYYGSRPHIDLRENRSMIDMDDPAHQAQRNLVARRFTPRGIHRRWSAAMPKDLAKADFVREFIDLLAKNAPSQSDTARRA